MSPIAFLFVRTVAMTVPLSGRWCRRILQKQIHELWHLSIINELRLFLYLQSKRSIVQLKETITCSLWASCCCCSSSYSSSFLLLLLLLVLVVMSVAGVLLAVACHSMSRLYTIDTPAQPLCIFPAWAHWKEESFVAWCHLAQLRCLGEIHGCGPHSQKENREKGQNPIITTTVGRFMFLPRSDGRLLWSWVSLCTWFQWNGCSPTVHFSCLPFFDLLHREKVRLITISSWSHTEMLSDVSICFMAMQDLDPHVCQKRHS